MTEANRKAWTAGRYDAWRFAFGEAAEAADRIVSDPQHVVRRLSPYLGEVGGKRICNVQGSHGRIAVALALLGAKVQVIDFSEENERFAMDLAKAADVSIDYDVCDILEVERLDLPHKFDVLVLELGILHYHQDLSAFFGVLRRLTRDGGMLFLNEFHPVQRKLFWPEGPHDYFFDGLVEGDVPNPNADGPSLGMCAYRFWTLGEVVTAIVENNFTITRLDEHPEMGDRAIPGTFTLLARA
ncbi:bifunctional 2-polyprenyl-6-hydroxyphenol methylase/3-demethylubiquinol 3-O-methyltransferase UbiG [Actibacterium sp. 188UL27-1]|uniref:class I SAM-dependent methyltransferase n=1 Tax=Actibacterium sp. 188UL27-1 TaxID=2786961 RepID=UPI00195C6A6E|nr:methyltransferase domain-containing protein [Actibacterium sp. 188UL27-1]MBM7068048.1 methyltransferase domain-containing protein [Actibacterium sp. 188UL27-1]